MAIENFNEDVEVIQKLDTLPNQEGGLSAEELKAKFDQAAIAIKNFINNSLLPVVRELEEAKDPSVIYGLDQTLSEPGRAADAKAVGDALAGKVGTKDIIGIAHGGTGAANAEDARRNLDAAKTAHTHSVGDMNTGLLPLERGGTGAGTAAQAMENLGITAALAGKAPAVYTYPSVNGLDANTIVNEYHKFVINGSNCAYDHGFLDVEKASGSGFTPNGAVPIIQQTMTDWSTGHKAYRISVDNGATWGEWEYESPPMELWKEYRTTKRWKGLTVYTKAINMDYFPANSFKTSGIGTTITSMVDFRGKMYTGNGNWSPFPFYENGTLKAYHWFSDTSIGVTTLADISGYSAHFVIEYTKD